MVEFTGERVIPGQVEPDLWNEHISRYRFALPLCSNRRILDIGCGTGYGPKLLAQIAKWVVGIDVSSEALELAQAERADNIDYVQTSAIQLPFPTGAFDLITAFEVIEHLEEWQKLLQEAKRVLAPGGTLLVSTPNKSYYAESRKLAGPNPFHHHEFELDEFRRELSQYFPEVEFFYQNHTVAVAIQSTSTESTNAHVEKLPNPGTSHFFVAACGATLPPSLVYVPDASNTLRERELHIEKLEHSLQELQLRHESLVVVHTENVEEMAWRAAWAETQNQKIRELGDQILVLQAELTQVHQDAERVIQQLNEENESKTRWAQETEMRLTAELTRTREQLTAYIQALEATEATLDERTRWAQQLDQERQALDSRLTAYDSSRWIRLGRRLGVGPQARG